MSQTVMIEITCDAEGCTRSVRAWHWTSGFAPGSRVRSKLRRRGWLTAKSDESTNHYCPDHRGNPAAYWRANIDRAKRASEWERGESA